MPKVSNQQAGIAIELSEKSMAAFNASLDRYLASVNIGRSKVIKKLGGAMLTDMVKASPVDTGRFRAGWNAGFRALGQRPPRGVATANQSLKARMEGDAAGKGRLTDDEAQTELWVRNGVRYGPYLEAGASAQARLGIVRLTIDRYRNFLDENMRRMPVQGAR